MQIKNEPNSLPRHNVKSGRNLRVEIAAGRRRQYITIVSQQLIADDHDAAAHPTSSQFNSQIAPFRTEANATHAA